MASILKRKVMFMKILLSFTCLILLASCSGDSGSLASSSPSSFTTQFSLLPDENFLSPYFNGNPVCLSETVSGQTVYYTQFYGKVSEINGAMNDGLDKIKSVYSDSGCTNMLYSIAYVNNLVSTTQSQSVSSTDISTFSLIDVQINVQSQTVVDDYNQNNYLGLTWQLNDLVSVVGRLDPSTNTVIYVSGTLTDITLRADVPNKKVYINGVEHWWP